MFFFFFGALQEIVKITNLKIALVCQQGAKKGYIF